MIYMITQRTEERMMPTIINDTYELKSILGKGGMSNVYLAEHVRLHTRWAVKEVWKNQSVRFDFMAESEILKRLQHPMLPRIVDIFETDKAIYIVEDFVEGLTLSELLEEQGKVEEGLGLQWLEDLCGVLCYLHGQEPPIIYRDLKPSNIMLIDFGIAREYKEDARGDTTYAGTRGYAAPEQFGRAQTDARTDLYSLGVTLYHLLTGKSPYEPPYQFVPVRKLNPKLSRGIEYILNKCVQPEPADRYQTAEALLEDLRHIYRFEDAWKKYQWAKGLRIGIVAVMLAASVGLMVSGQALMRQEKEDAYSGLLTQAMDAVDYENAASLPEEARSLFPDRVDADRQQTYALYRSGAWQACVDFGGAALERCGPDQQTRLAMASAQFEPGAYEAAAEGFAQGGDLSADNLRDYAVCLGRLGRVEEAEGVLNTLTGQGARPDVTRYVQGEVLYAQQEYLEAEAAFLGVLEETEDAALLRRCYGALGDLYRDCGALARVGASPITNPATKSAELLSAAVVQEGLRYDSALWEALALAYFEAYHTDKEVPADYLTKAANCFTRVIELGVVKEYLYANLYTVYYESGDYAKAEQALRDYEAAFPEDYMPHALRGMLLITEENGKPQSARNYQAALREYETAGAMLRSPDDTNYYQQLGSLIDNLKRNGWL